jgi:hypothetical protein
LSCVCKSSLLPCLCYLSCPSTSSYYHQAMDPTLHHIIITNFHAVLVATSSFTSFILLPKQNIYLNPSKLKFMKLSFQRAIIRVKQVPNKRVVPFLLRRCNLYRVFLEHAAPYVYVISSCTVLQNWWFLMHWKEGLKDLLNINFSSIVHLWTRAQTLMEISTCLSSLVDD